MQDLYVGNSNSSIHCPVPRGVHWHCFICILKQGRFFFALARDHCIQSFGIFFEAIVSYIMQALLRADGRCSFTWTRKEVGSDVDLFVA
jgi:hypothetical protein